MRCKLQTSSIALANATRFIDPCASSGVYSTETVGPVPTAGTFRKLYCKLLSDPDTGSPGSTNGYTFTLRKNAAGTGTPGTVAVTILSNTPSFQGSDLVNSSHFAAGDLVSIQIAPSGVPTATPRFTISLEFESDSSNESILLGGIVGAATLPATTGNFVCIAGQKAPTTTETDFLMVMPCAGQITQLYCQLNTAPGNAGTASRSFQLRVNTSNAGTPVSYGTADTGVKSQSQSITIAAGDRVCLESDATNTPATSRFGCSIVFKPTVDGQFAIPCSAPSGNLSNSALRFAAPAISGTTYTGTEANAQQLITTDMALLGYTAYFGAALSGGTYTVSLRENTAAARTTFQSGITTQGPNTVSGGPYVTAADFNLYNTGVQPSSLPTATTLMLSWLGWCGPIQMISHVGAGGTTNTVTTGAIDTTGATLIVLMNSSSTALPTISDSKGNTYTPLTIHAPADPTQVLLYYCLNPAVGSGHTFTSAHANGFPSVCVAAFSGATVYDSQENGSFATASTLATGNVTPSVINALVVAGMGGNGNYSSISPSFTLLDFVNFGSGAHYSCALTYYTPITTSAVGTTFTFGTSSANGAGIAVFRIASATGGGQLVQGSLVGGFGLVGGS